MLSFKEFLSEGYATGAGNAKDSSSNTLPMSDNPVAAGKNHADPTIEAVRSHLLDIFWPKAEGDKKRETIINQCVTTFVHAMDKKLRIDEDIIKMLADASGMSQSEATDLLSKNMDKYFSQFQNMYGMTS